MIPSPERKVQEQNNAMQPGMDWTTSVELLDLGGSDGRAAKRSRY